MDKNQSDLSCICYCLFVPHNSSMKRNEMRPVLYELFLLLLLLKTEIYVFYCIVQFFPFLCR